jgi:hypothetical protein
MPGEEIVKEGRDIYRADRASIKDHRDIKQ